MEEEIVSKCCSYKIQEKDGGFYCKKCKCECEFVRFVIITKELSDSVKIITDYVESYNKQDIDRRVAEANYLLTTLIF